ncbi:MAG: undecaprenyl-diphosphatase UppP [Proteobacteria bacterium]|nr:undecaprenyl-diphosphatase UppP [Pseudomonadota bacterium]
MSTIQAIILGIVQGLTEFLPVSSSGHLVLVPAWLGWENPGLAFGALLHWGTLLAVLLYFWRDWVDMISAVWGRLRGRPDLDGNARLFLLITIGTLPAAGVGFLFEGFFEAMFDNPTAVAFFMIVTGFILVFAERYHRSGLTVASLTVKDTVVVGFGQALAILPGISRSGSTMAVGMVQGLERPLAARFSFLLGTPIIFGAGLLQLRELFGGQTLAGNGDLVPLLAGFLAAAITGFLCIRYLLRYLQNHSLYVFAIYVWIFAGLTLLRIAFFA